MKIITLGIGGCLLACLFSLASAQTNVDRSFTASGRDCSSVQWTDTALRTYPSIAAACRTVLERDGTTYVQFKGTLTRNIDRGKQLKVKFEGADEMTLTPQAQTQLGVYVDGRKVQLADLQAGDNLTFYVAEDRLAARFYPENESPATSTEYVLVPIFYSERLAQAPQAPEAAARPMTLPATGSTLPLIGICGVLVIGIASMLSLRRLSRGLEE